MGILPTRSARTHSTSHAACLVNTPPRSLCRGRIHCTQESPKPTSKPRVYMNSFTQLRPFTFLMIRVTQAWWIAIPSAGRVGFTWSTTATQARQRTAVGCWAGIDSWSLCACHFRHLAQASVGVCSVWQLENNNRLRASRRCREETLTNQPGLPQIRVDWLFLYDPEDNRRNWWCTSWNRIGSKYEMGSQGAQI